MALAHRTEAAVRFERGIDLEGILPVISQGTALMKDLGGGIVASKLIDLYPHPQEKRKIKLDLDLVNKIIGIEIPKEKVIAILRSLGFSLLTTHSPLLTFSVPSWRIQDVFIEEDLIEEIARIYGYYRLPGNLPPLDPHFGFSPQPQPKMGKIGPFFEWEKEIKDFLVNQGFSEVYNYSFISADLIKKVGLKTENHLKLKNPLTADLEYLRTSLFPSLLKTVSQNQANFPKMKIFEMANVYLPQQNNLPLEKTRLTCLLLGGSFAYLKGIAETILKQMGIEEVYFKPWVGREPYFTQGKTAIIETSKNALGTMGEIHPQILANFEIANEALVLDLDFEILVKLAKTTKTFSPIPKYPAIIEDLTFILKPKTPVGELIQTVKDLSSIIQSVELIDSYQNTRTLRITYQDPRKTLSDKEVSKLREKIIKKIKEKFGAQVKS
jgi:phenylalanyl-tRNA synthetase beta chain